MIHVTFSVIFAKETTFVISCIIFLHIIFLKEGCVSTLKGKKFAPDRSIFIFVYSRHLFRREV